MQFRVGVEDQVGLGSFLYFFVCILVDDIKVLFFVILWFLFIVYVKQVDKKFIGQLVIGVKYLACFGVIVVGFKGVYVVYQDGYFWWSEC